MTDKILTFIAKRVGLPVAAVGTIIAELVNCGALCQNEKPLAICERIKYYKDLDSRGL